MGYKLCCAHRIELIIARKLFSKLCCPMPKINTLVLDSWSLNQYWLLSHVETRLLASLRLTL